MKTLKLLSFFLLLSIINSCQSKEQLPNIIIIFTDDQGYADLGCFGAQSFNTPNIDKLAEEGMRFTNFYASEGVCSASRASLLTGCYAKRVSIKGALMPFTPYGLNPEETTIAELLKQKGYATGMVGKWHLGFQKEFLPPQQGFDEYFGLPYSNDMWPIDFDGTPITAKSKRKWKLMYPPLTLIDGERIVDTVKNLADMAQLTTKYTQWALKFIERYKSRPFFLYFAHSMPHVPLGVSDKYKGKSAQGMYGDVIEEIDWSVGEITKKLKELGLEENTLIIYTSDNGPWLNFGNHAGSAYPLREGKGTAFEGGVREPTVMKWSGHIPKNTVCNQIASTIDILPSIAAITGTKLPDNKIDGINILSLMEGKNILPRDEFIYYYTGELRAVRKGKWKLFFPHTSRSYQGVEPGKDGYPGKTKPLKVGLELYDLENDIGETNNVAEQYPEIVDSLSKIAEKMRKELGDDLTGIKGSGVRPPGRILSERTEKIKHLAENKTVSYSVPYSKKYSGGGNSALVDGYRGSLDFGDGHWQAFRDNQPEISIDLGKATKISNITCSFLQNQNAWIFAPIQITYSISNNNTKFKKIKNYEISLQKNYLQEIKEYSYNFKPEEVRYIKISIKGIKALPEWHQAAGKKPWIFIDEIIVK